MGYKFIRTPYVSYDGRSDNKIVKFYLPQDATLDEMLESYADFLRAAGYSVEGTLDVVTIDEPPITETDDEDPSL